MYNNYVHVLTFPGTMPSMNTSLSSESLLDEIEKSRSKLRVFVISRNGSLGTERLVRGGCDNGWLGGGCDVGWLGGDCDDGWVGGVVFTGDPRSSTKFTDFAWHFLGLFCFPVFFFSVLLPALFCFGAGAAHSFFVGGSFSVSVQLWINSR